MTSFSVIVLHSGMTIIIDSIFKEMMITGTLYHHGCSCCRCRRRRRHHHHHHHHQGMGRLTTTTKIATNGKTMSCTSHILVPPQKDSAQTNERRFRGKRRSRCQPQLLIRTAILLLLLLPIIPPVISPYLRRFRRHGRLHHGY
jgi:hypothetical protein